MSNINDNLPPGCTVRDIEDAAGIDDETIGYGEFILLVRQMREAQGRAKHLPNLLRDALRLEREVDRQIEIQIADFD